MEVEGIIVTIKMERGNTLLQQMRPIMDFLIKLKYKRDFRHFLLKKNKLKKIVQAFFYFKDKKKFDFFEMFSAEEIQKCEANGILITAIL